MIDETTKYVDRKNMDKADALREADKPKPPRKEGKSPFDEMLEQSKQLQQGSIDTKTQSKTATQQAIQELEKHQEKQKDQSKDRDKEDERKQDSRDDRSQSTYVSKKVVGKEGLKQQQGESGGGGFEGGGTGSKKGEHFVSSKKLTSGQTNLQIASTQFGKAFEKALTKQSSELPKQLSQEVLNQIVRYVRIGLSKEGHKEIELDLHEKVFKGLRLRLSAKHGKVRIHFLAANLAVRKLFSSQALNIEAELKAKGVAVEEIKVT